MFVGDNRHTDSCSADEDAEFGSSLAHCLRNTVCEIGVVGRCGRICAEILKLHVQQFQNFLDLFFVGEPDVVRSESDHKICLLFFGMDEPELTDIDAERESENLSIGDYVLTNGGLPAMVIIDTVARLIPGVLGHDESAQDESFSHGLLEYPHYTRPAEFRGMKVPEVLMSGNHAEIEKWRREQSRLRTQDRRPDLLK